MRETPILLTPGEAAGRLLPLLEAGASVPLRVTGSSMVPFLRDRRDLVFLRAPRFRRDDGPPFSPRRMDQRLLQRLWGALIPFRRPLLRLLGRLSRLRA